MNNYSWNFQVGAWLKSTDTDSDGKLSFREFSKAVMDLATSNPEEEN